MGRSSTAAAGLGIPLRDLAMVQALSPLAVVPVSAMQSAQELIDALSSALQPRGAFQYGPEPAATSHFGQLAVDAIAQVAARSDGFLAWSAQTAAV
jgi:hypothetical protein